MLVAASVVRLRGVAMKSKLSAALAALALSAGAANASTYNVNFNISGVDVTGMIVTDCDSCALLPINITSFLFTFTGLLSSSFSGSTSTVAGTSPFPLSAANGIIDFTGAGGHES
jgi:hypothetical protein